MAKQPPTNQATRLQGKVLAFNFSPKGHVEGALVETEQGTAQLNFMKHTQSLLSHSLHAGAQLDLMVEPESERGDHPVYRVVDEEAELTGTIVRLNYTVHGEVNGYHLDEGTFVHVKPDGAKKYKLHIGQKVIATGRKHEGPDAVVVEATSVEKVAHHEAHAHH